MSPPRTPLSRAPLGLRACRTRRTSRSPRRVPVPCRRPWLPRGSRPDRLAELPLNVVIGVVGLERTQTLDQLHGVGNLVAPRDRVTPEHRGGATRSHRVLHDAVEYP